jgi:hypothetical protein
MDCLPGERPADGGVINLGYVGDLGVQVSCICKLISVRQNYLVGGYVIFSVNKLSNVHEFFAEFA